MDINGDMHVNIIARDKSCFTENDLSSEINFSIYGADEDCDWFWSDNIYVDLCIHRGGNHRNNYGATQVYKVDSLADTGFFDVTIGWHVESAPLSSVHQNDLSQKQLEGLTWAVREDLTEFCSPNHARLPSSILSSETTGNDYCYWRDGSAYMTDGKTVWKAAPYHHHAALLPPKDGSGWISEASIDTEYFLAETLGCKLDTPDDVAQAWDHDEVVKDWITRQEMDV